MARCPGFCGIELILILFNVWMVIGVIITYVISVHNDHVKPFLPYISNTGSYPPESCVFSFVLSCGAIVAFVIVWIRYRHIKGHYADSPAKVQLLNAVSFFFGFLSVFGILLVSSFQDANVLPVHLVGAFMSFICGAVYSCLQTLLSYRLRKAHPQHVRCCVFAIRIVISIVISFVVLLAIIFGVASRIHCPPLRLYSGPVTKCYALHLVSAFAEWLSLLLTAVYFLTFHPDFKRIHADLHIRLRHHHSDVDENTPLI